MAGKQASPFTRTDPVRSSVFHLTFFPLYEEMYCARGEMENRIKECQLDLFADRTSAATMRANQLRLWFASMAYVLVTALRRKRISTSPARSRKCTKPSICRFYGRMRVLAHLASSIHVEAPS